MLRVQRESEREISGQGLQREKSRKREFGGQLFREREKGGIRFREIHNEIFGFMGLVREGYREKQK